jgi:hypothetical protein
VAPRNPGDVVGGGGGGGGRRCYDLEPLPHVRTVDAHIRGIQNDDYTEILAIHHFIQRAVYDARPHYRDRGAGAAVDDFQVNLDLRIKVLANQMDEKTWMQTLQRREKKKAFKESDRELLQLLVNVAVDNFIRLLSGAIVKPPGTAHQPVVETFFQEMNGIRDYFNECRVQNAARFNSTALMLIQKEAWMWQRY